MTTPRRTSAALQAGTTAFVIVSLVYGLLSLPTAPLAGLVITVVSTWALYNMVRIIRAGRDG